MTPIEPPAPRRHAAACAAVPPTGVGFKPEHAEAIAADAGCAGFFEVHAENYMGAGGAPQRLLERLRRDHALSLHGVALSIGGSQPPCREHLARFAALVRRCEPFLVSEHLAWSTHAGRCYNDLLPLPYTPATLARVCAHVDAVQTAIGRRLMLENPATYVRFEASTIPETEFLAEVARRTGCGLLLDVANLYVSAVNHGRSAAAALDAFPVEHVGQMHLAGHAVQAGRGHDGDDGPDAGDGDGIADDGAPLLIDSHDGPVPDAVWALFERALQRGVHVPTLVEWDSRLPPWPELRAQAEQAGRRLRQAAAQPAAWPTSHPEAAHA